MAKFLFKQRLQTLRTVAGPGPVRLVGLARIGLYLAFRVAARLPARHRIGEALFRLAPGVARLVRTKFVQYQNMMNIQWDEPNLTEEALALPKRPVEAPPACLSEQESAIWLRLRSHGIAP